VPWLQIAVAVVALASALGGWWRRRGHIRADGVAARAGLQYSHDDPFDSTRIAFPLFRKGVDRAAENVMWRDAHDDRPVHAFDYWYYDVHTDQTGRACKTYHWYSCATALIGGSWPLLTVEPESLAHRIGTHLGLSDIDLESEQFNRMFALHCEDRKFATTLIDPAMMALLVGTGATLTFQVRGRWLLVHADRVDSRALPQLLRVAEQFVAHVPKVVWDLYPSPFADREGDLLPAALAALPVGHETDHEDPWDTLEHSPYGALEKPDHLDYDLDGHVLSPRDENPWGDLPGGRPDHQ
jgi:hypothetical protein